MKKKKLAIVGTGGRTGTMFAFELKEVFEVLGVGKKKEVESIKGGNFFIRRRGKIEQFQEKIIGEKEFPADFLPIDFLILATKNPVAPAIEYYYQKIKEKGVNPPSLLISQNGLGASKEAISTLKEILGKEIEKIQVIRISLFNSVIKEEVRDKIYVSYNLPIRLAISKISGPGNIKEIVELFKKAKIEVTEIPEKDSKNMEFSKLFLNLFGMASASKDFSFQEGLKNPEILKEEILAIKEYIKVVKKIGGKFLNFPHYPVKFFAFLIKYLPINFFLMFRGRLTRMIEKGRAGKSKELDEIDYYNGVVVRLGERVKFPTPINKKIVQRVKYDRN